MARSPNLIAALVGAGIISGGGSSPSGQTSNVLAANRGQFPTTTAVIPDNTASMREFWASPEGDITDLVVTDVNTYINGSFALATGSTATFMKFLEYPVGVFTQLLYGGLTTYTLGAGIASSDPLSSVTITKGTRGWLHTVLVSGGSNLAMVELPANADAIGVTDTKYAWTGAPAHPAPQAALVFFGSNFITGTVKGTSAARGVGIVGHSIPFGQGDISSSGVKGGSGYHARGLDSRYPYAKFCKGGMSGTDMAALRGSGTLASLIKACGLTDVIQDFTGGDLRIGNTVQATKDAIQTVFGMFGNAKRFYQVTCTDRTDSTDAYATVVNQTPKTDGNWASQIALNTDIRAGLPRVTAVLDIAAQSSSAFNSGVWNGSPARTTDGVHPNSFEAARLATFVTAFDFTIPAPVGSWSPSALGASLVAAWDTNDVSQVTVDGSNNLTRMRASFGGGDILPGGSPDVSDVGGVAGNKRVITFAAGEYLQSTDARILLAANGVIATEKVTIIEAVKYVAGATSRGFLWGSIGGTGGAPNFGMRQTTTNRGPTATPVAGGSAYSAFQTTQDGNWHVHAVIKDGNNFDYRVDGVSVAVGTIVGGTSFAFSQFLVGAVVGAVAGTPGSINPLSAHAGMLIADDALSGTALASAEAWVGATAGL
ncbi:hypothetical protein [Rhizobium redzepovicii]|uniref:hypothetical protein n=1 Tax=Rhizobium redzepovicii TaxID=2867518 RepID=UPI0028722946|nr:hypothetical protein [Rhizobium redzepovicii]MDR9781599.1 hypothetical protein [Rhizobium redzepovicii]